MEFALSEEFADQVLRVAECPDFFIFEEDADEERSAALHVLCMLVQQMPVWSEKARPLLEECALADTPRCQPLAAKALQILNARKFKRSLRGMAASLCSYF